MEELIARGDQSPLQPPAQTGRVVILTSGTTGTPKGAKRKQPDSLEPAAALFSKIPLKARETTVIAAPMFHSWGYGHFTLALPLASTLVLRRRFDPEQTLADVARHRASALAAVPVMLQRIMELPQETLEALRHLGAADHLNLGLGAPRRAGHAGDGHVRGGALRPVRLHRGRVGDDRHPTGPTRCPGHSRAPTAGNRGEDPRRRGAGAGAGTSGGGSSPPTRWCSTATPGVGARRSCAG